MLDLNAERTLPRGEDDFKNYVAESLRHGSGRIAALEGHVTELRADSRANMELTKKTSDDVKEFLEIFRAVRGGFKVLGWLGSLAKWVTIMAGAAAIVALVMGWRWPSK